MKTKESKNKPPAEGIKKDQFDYQIWGQVLILCLTFLFSYLFIFDQKLDLNGDNFNYLNYAKSISDGHGYSSPYNEQYSPTNWYPPGYSAILSMAMFVTGKSVAPLKILNGLFFLGSILLIYFTIKKVTENSAIAFVSGFLLLLNSGLLKFSTILMAEMPYLFFSCLAFYTLTHIKDEQEASFWKSKPFYILVIAVVATYYFRSVGITLIGAVVAYYTLRGKWKLLGAFLGGVFILYLPYVIRNSIHGLKGRYLGTVLSVNPWRPEEGDISSFSQFFEKVLVNLNDTVIKGFPEVIFPFFNVQKASPTTLMIVGTLVVLVTLFGCWKLNKFRYFFLAYILGNIFIFLIWHTGNGARYVWPLAPFIFFGFIYGVYELIKLPFKNKESNLLKWLPYATILLAFLFIPKLQTANKASQKSYSPAYKNYFKLAKYVGKLKQNDLTVSCRKPGMFHFYSDTYVGRYKFSLDDQEVIKDLIDRDVDYVVLEQLGYSSTYRYLFPAINKHKELFKVEQHLKNPDTYLLKFDKERAMQKLGYQGGE